MEMPPPGWYQDPAGSRNLLRWWDGTQWTARTAAMNDATRPDLRHGHATQVLAPGDSSARMLHFEEGPGGGSGPAPWERGSAPAGPAAPGGPRWTLGGTSLSRVNRTRLMWALALGAAVAVLLVGGLVAILGSAGPPMTPAAATAHPSAASTMSPSPSPSATSPAPPATTGTPVTDSATGLTYPTLTTPWQAGCPTSRSNSTFTWTAGEGAVAGTVGSGPDSAWYGSACSGLLGQQYPYAGVADLAQTATNLVNAFDPAYYNGLPHSRSTTENNPFQVSGHPAWIVKYVMSYPTAASQGLPWQAEMGAVVVVDRGAGQPPAVLFVTVPDNLGLSNVDVILQSLQMAAPPPATGTAIPPSAPAGGSGVAG
jgi:hypothetical protein